MMNELQIRDKVITQIAKGQTHVTYNDTVEVAKHWKKIVSGEGQEQILLKFRDQDSKAQREQRVKLFNTHTPYLANRIKTVFEEVDRCDSIREVLDVKEDLQDKIPTETYNRFQDELSNFYQEKSVDNYLDEQMYEIAATDPNAYLLVSFMAFNREEGELPKTYPLIYSSDQVFQKYYDYKGLRYICFRTMMAAPVNKDETAQDYKKHYRYTLWTDDFSYEIYLGDTVEEHKLDVEGFSKISVPMEDKPVEVYWRQYRHLSNRVPAIRLGYVKSVTNDFAIAESPLLPAKHLFNEHIQKKSTADNHLTLYGYLRAFFYEQKCDNKIGGKPCVNGKINGEECPNCGGTGTQGQATIHRSEQDIITFTIPLAPNATNEDIIDLSKLVHYVPIPKEVMELNRKEVDDLSLKIALALFNSDVFNRNELVAGVTATEIKQRLKSVNNVIYKYASHKAKVWVFIVSQIAKYFGIDEYLDINREYPSDFKLETVQELMALLKDAKSNATMEVVRKIEMDIITKMYVDDPDLILMVKAKNAFKPFYNKTEAEAISSVGMLPEKHPKRILWLFFDDIFHEIERLPNLPGIETADADKRFYALPYEKQKAVVDNIVQRYIDEYKTDPAPVIEMPFSQSQDPEADPDGDGNNPINEPDPDEEGDQ